jgi:hypothetical protein
VARESLCTAKFSEDVVTFSLPVAIADFRGVVCCLGGVAWCLACILIEVAA